MTRRTRCTLLPIVSIASSTKSGLRLCFFAFDTISAFSYKFAGWKDESNRFGRGNCAGAIASHQSA
jgi:hypothetical protein